MALRRLAVGDLAGRRGGGPLCLTHPAPELGYVLDDARPLPLLFDDEFAPIVGPLAAERGVSLMASEVDR